MSIHDNEAQPPLIGELTSEQYRQRLAGLLDPQENQSPERRAEMKELAVRFAAALPEVFGPSLDRKTMWDRIGSGLQAAFAKTAGDDHEFFIGQVLDHVKADAGEASGNEKLARVMQTLAGWPAADRQAWIAYFNGHLIPVLIHARAGWSEVKEAAKARKAQREREKDLQALDPAIESLDASGDR